MPGSLSPAPWFTALDSNGNPLPGAKLFTYDSGTSVKRATYTDADLTSAHPNPIILDSAGRAVIYLSPTSYKFVLAPATDIDPPVAPIKTVDPVGAVPLTDVDLDIAGTAGENLIAGDVVFLSDGSGGNTAGTWYKAAYTVAWASTEAKAIGMVPAAIASGDVGSIRLQGRIEGLAALTAGVFYYMGAAAGSLDAAPIPTAHKRIVGVADSTTSLVMAEKPNMDLRRAASFETTVGNVGVGEDILATTTRPVGELSTNGMSYKGTFWGHTANNANAKTLRARVIEGANNSQIAGAACAINELGSWVLHFEVKRFSAVLAIYEGEISCGPALAARTISTNNVFGGTITWANAVELRVTGDATANNDITVEGGTVTLVP
jgi:hypothetical protein